MQKEELEKFQIELQALLIKYDCTLTIGQSIQVNKNAPASTAVTKISKKK